MRQNFGYVYREFALRFEVLPTSPVCRISARSHAGQAHEAVPLAELKAALRSPSAAAVRSLGPAVGGGQGHGDGEPEARDVGPIHTASFDARQLGGRLFEILLPGKVRDLFFQSIAWLNRTDHGLRIELHFDDSSAAFFAAPWELLYQGQGDWLGLGPRTPIVRCLDVPRPTDLEAWQPPLKILVIAANPLGTPPLALGTERELIERAWRGSAAVDIALASSTEPRALREAVREGRYHVLHFMGHADFSFTTGEGSLLLAGNDRQPQRLTGEVVGNLVKAWLPRLVVLNACNTARAAGGEGGGGDIFYRGLGSSLIQAGVPAVVGMQSPIRDEAAVAFAQELYRRLADGWPVDAAVAEGRHALYLATPGSLDWAAPVVLMQMPRADLFAPTRAPGAAASPPSTPQAPNPLDIAPGDTPRRWFDDHFPRLHRLLVGLGVLLDPPERRWLAHQLGDLPRQLANEHWHRNYVPLDAEPLAGHDRRMEAAAAESDASGPNPTVQVHLRHVLGTAAGGDRASAYLAAVNRRTERVSNVERLLRRSRLPLVLLGEPGSGKTTVLRRAAEHLIAAEQRRVFPRVVVFVRLGSFHVADRAPNQHHVHELVRGSCPRTVQSFFPELFAAGRLIVLFDGLDEMSRGGYNDHTIALSEFGHDLRQRGGRVFFSCRLADFSHELHHERLVLLPFDYGQIRQYLAFWFADGQVIIAGERRGVRELALQLATDREQLDTTNPFILSLLCNYLFHRRAWPESRISLIRQLLEEQYRAKGAAAAAVEEQPFPGRERAFRAWSRFAWLITERNQGADIPVASLIEDGADTDVPEMIRAGSWCGVLTEDNDTETYKVRFEHHRYQEYFAALWIHHNSDAVDWLAKLESARWQETMVNLALMGGAEDGISALADAIWRERYSLDEQFAACDAWEVEKKQDYFLKTPRPSPSHDDEALLAEHVELGARLLAVKAVSAAATGSLRFQLRKALHLLVEHGSPDSQVRMLQACKDLGDDVVEVCGKLRQSPVQWVRDEALEIAPGASEMGVDLAVGDLLPRLPAYLRGVRARRNRQSGTELAIAAAVGLAHFGLVLAVAWCASKLTLAYLLLYGRRDELGPLRHDLSQNQAARYLWPQEAVTFLVLLLAAARVRGRAWLWGLGGVPVGIGALCAARALRYGKYGSGWLALILGAELLCLLPVVASLCAPGHFLLLAVYAATERGRRFFDRFRDLARIAWQGAGYSSAIWFFALGIPLTLLPLFRRSLSTIARAIDSFVDGSRQFLSDLWLTVDTRFGIPYLKGVSELVLPVALAAAVVAGYRWSRARYDPYAISPGFRKLGWALAYLGVAAGTLTLVIEGELLQDALDGWFSRRLGHAITLTVDALLLVVLLLIPLYGLWEGARQLQARRPGRAAPPNSFTPEEWKARIRKADSTRQQQLLLTVTHQSLGLDTAAFHQLLTEIGPLIRKSEPAQSTYWQRLYQLKRALRQERRG